MELPVIVDHELLVGLIFAARAISGGDPSLPPKSLISAAAIFWSLLQSSQRKVGLLEIDSPRLGFNSTIALRCRGSFACHFCSAPGCTDYKELKLTSTEELPTIATQPSKTPAISHVKPQNLTTHYQTTTYRWHVSYLQSAILK